MKKDNILQFVWISCLVFLLTLCYFGIDGSVKGTQSADTVATCPDGFTDCAGTQKGGRDCECYKTTRDYTYSSTYPSSDGCTCMMSAEVSGYCTCSSNGIIVNGQGTCQLDGSCVCASGSTTFENNCTVTSGGSVAGSCNGTATCTCPAGYPTVAETCSPTTTYSCPNGGVYNNSQCYYYASYSSVEYCTDGTGTMTEDGCVYTSCDAGKYLNNGKCYRCPAGRYCQGGSKAEYCPAGTYSTGGASECTPCGEGKTSPTGATSVSSCYDISDSSGEDPSSPSSPSNNSSSTPSTNPGSPSNNSSGTPSSPTSSVERPPTVNNSGPGGSSNASTDSNNSSEGGGNGGSTTSSGDESSVDGESSNENVDENPGTGEITMFIVWSIALVAICYSVWYFKGINES